MNRRDVHLSKRMEAVVSMVSPQSFTIADVGCDHAYVSIALMQRGLANKVIAMDVRTGPLDIAIRNITEAGYGEVIDVRLGDGLERLRPGEADGIIIAGMGGLLMKGILERGMHILTFEDKRPELILQPQSDINAIRIFLHEQAYDIVRESMVLEEGKYYTVIYAKPCERQEQVSYTEEQWLYGKYNLDTRNEVLQEYLLKEENVLACILEKLQDIIQKAEQQGKEVPKSTRERMESAEKELEINRRALSYYVGE
ncbi:MAG: SAM-dependent methyltransferase [Lachnospiraceae bacterium]|nr:SAM-dependent methyltransferase [Lachnospiraceae bacterium]